MKVKLKANLGKEYGPDPEKLKNGMVVNVRDEVGERLIAKALAEPTHEQVTKVESKTEEPQPDFDSMTIPELREVATQKSVEIPASAHKDEIVKTLKKAK